MFCDATPSTITQMLGILQEHGELVISCGSGLNLHNMPTFAKADLSISVEPLPPSRELLQSRPSGEARGEADLAAELSSVPCALTLGRNWSMAALIDIICVSRMLLDAMRQAYVFVVTAATLHMAVALSGNCLFLPRILDHSQVLVTLLVIVPIHLVAIVRSGCAIATNVKAWNPMRLKLSTKVPPSALRPPRARASRTALRAGRRRSTGSTGGGTPCTSPRACYPPPGCSSAPSSSRSATRCGAAPLEPLLTRLPRVTRTNSGGRARRPRAGRPQHPAGASEWRRRRRADGGRAPGAIFGAAQGARGPAVVGGTLARAGGAPRPCRR
jgi:hypothetical protein